MFERAFFGLGGIKMCGGPDIEAEREYLDALVLTAFKGFKDYVRLYLTGDEKKTDWIEAFLEGIGSRLRAFEKEGKLVDPLKNNWAFTKVE